MELEIWTDGSFYQDKKIGSWSFVVTKNNKELYSSYGIHFKAVSNNHMELLAVLEAFRTTSKYKKGKLLFHSDSEMLVDGITMFLPKWAHNNWRKTNNKPLTHLEIWKDIYKYVKNTEHVIKWVKSHRDHKWNNRADALAREAIQEYWNAKQLKLF